jgi:hypothetical protein
LSVTDISIMGAALSIKAGAAVLRKKNMTSTVTPRNRVLLKICSRPLHIRFRDSVSVVTLH